MKKIFLNGLFFFLMLASLALAGAGPVWAEDYENPNYENLIKTLVRFSAVDINDDIILDNYARIQECKLYRKFYDDDFRWNEFRKAFRESIRRNVATYPTSYRYDATLQLDRYDFKKGLYAFTGKTAVRNSNLFVLSAGQGEFCDKRKKNIFPEEFQLVLDEPLFIPGLPLPQQDANVLLKRMDNNGNINHFIYTRFNMRIVYIAPLYRPKTKDSEEIAKLQQDTKNSAVRFDARLDSVDFFEDEAKERLIYSYRP